jgi:hypothetical protein
LSSAKAKSGASAPEPGEGGPPLSSKLRLASHHQTMCYVYLLVSIDHPRPTLRRVNSRFKEAATRSQSTAFNTYREVCSVEARRILRIRTRHIGH